MFQLALHCSDVPPMSSRSTRSNAGTHSVPLDVPNPVSMVPEGDSQGADDSQAAQVPVVVTHGRQQDVSASRADNAMSSSSILEDSVRFRAQDRSNFSGILAPYGMPPPPAPQLSARPVSTNGRYVTNMPLIPTQMTDLVERNQLRDIAEVFKSKDFLKLKSIQDYDSWSTSFKSKLSFIGLDYYCKRQNNNIMSDRVAKFLMAFLYENVSECSEAKLWIGKAHRNGDFADGWSTLAEEVSMREANMEVNLFVKLLDCKPKERSLAAVQNFYSEVTQIVSRISESSTVPQGLILKTIREGCYSVSAQAASRVSENVVDPHVYYRSFCKELAGIEHLEKQQQKSALQSALSANAVASDTNSSSSFRKKKLPLSHEEFSMVKQSLIRSIQRQEHNGSKQFTKDDRNKQLSGKKRKFEEKQRKQYGQRASNKSSTAHAVSSAITDTSSDNIHSESDSTQSDECTESDTDSDVNSEYSIRSTDEKSKTA